MNGLGPEIKSDLIYGSCGGCVSYPVSVLTIKTSRYFFEKWNLPFDRYLLSKNFNWLYQSINTIKNYFLRSILKTFLVAYLVLIAPIFEEWAFRGVLYRYQEPYQDPPSRIVTSAVVFGAFHLSYFHGLASVPYFLVATISGLIYAGLREWTNSWHAPAVAHGISNACVIAFETLR